MLQFHGHEPIVGRLSLLVFPFVIAQLIGVANAACSLSPSSQSSHPSHLDSCEDDASAFTQTLLHSLLSREHALANRTAQFLADFLTPLDDTLPKAIQDRMAGDRDRVLRRAATLRNLREKGSFVVRPFQALESIMNIDSPKMLVYKIFNGELKVKCTKNVFLGSEIPWTDCNNQYFTRCSADQGYNMGERININGRFFMHGLAIHAAGSATFHVKGEYNTFSSCVGIKQHINDPECGVTKGHARFRVMGDGALIRDWTTAGPGSNAQCFAVDITGVHNLVLETDHVDEAHSCDHSTWGNAKVLNCQKVERTPILKQETPFLGERKNFHIWPRRRLKAHKAEIIYKYREESEEPPEPVVIGEPPSPHQVPVSAKELTSGVAEDVAATAETAGEAADAGYSASGKAAMQLASDAAAGDDFWNNMTKLATEAAGDLIPDSAWEVIRVECMPGLRERDGKMLDPEGWWNVLTDNFPETSQTVVSICIAYAMSGGESKDSVREFAELNKGTIWEKMTGYCRSGMSENARVYGYSGKTVDKVIWNKGATQEAQYCDPVCAFTWACDGGNEQSGLLKPCNPDQHNWYKRIMKWCSYIPVTWTVPTPNVTAIGDPHLMNILGQRFEVNKEGEHTLVQIPKGSGADLEIKATIQRFGKGTRSCRMFFFQSFRLSGGWVGDDNATMEVHVGDNGTLEGFGLTHGNTRSTKKGYIEFNRLAIADGPSKAEGAQVQACTKDVTGKTKEICKAQMARRLRRNPKKILLELKGPVAKPLRVLVSRYESADPAFIDIAVAGLNQKLGMIGGLLGIDDHSEVEKVPDGCPAPPASTEPMGNAGFQSMVDSDKLVGSDSSDDLLDNDKDVEE